MGELQVPEDALWGTQTQRAVNNFPISGLQMPRQFIAALGLTKWAAAGANAELGLLDSGLAVAIQKAALSVAIEEVAIVALPPQLRAHRPVSEASGLRPEHGSESNRIR